MITLYIASEVKFVKGFSPITILPIPPTPFWEIEPLTLTEPLIVWFPTNVFEPLAFNDPLTNTPFTPTIVAVPALSSIFK